MPLLQLSVRAQKRNPEQSEILNKRAKLDIFYQLTQVLEANTEMFIRYWTEPYAPNSRDLEEWAAFYDMTVHLLLAAHFDPAIAFQKQDYFYCSEVPRYERVLPIVRMDKGRPWKFTFEKTQYEHIWSPLEKDLN